jgi:hypothetical protein
MPASKSQFSGLLLAVKKAFENEKKGEYPCEGCDSWKRCFLERTACRSYAHYLLGNTRIGPGWLRRLRPKDSRSDIYEYLFNKHNDEDEK